MTARIEFTVIDSRTMLCINESVKIAGIKGFSLSLVDTGVVISLEPHNICRDYLEVLAEC